LNLKELNEYFQELPRGCKFSYKLSEPYSWRGVYAEVCFTVIEEASTREENIKAIDNALPVIRVKRYGKSKKQTTGHQPQKRGSR